MPCQSHQICWRSNYSPVICCFCPHIFSSVRIWLIKGTLRTAFYSGNIKTFGRVILFALKYSPHNFHNFIRKRYIHFFVTVLLIFFWKVMFSSGCFICSRLDISVVEAWARVAVSSGTAPKVHCLASIVHQTGRVDTGEGAVDVAMQWEQINPVASAGTLGRISELTIEIFVSF